MPHQTFTRTLGIRHPVVQAPMAGGTTTPELVAAVSNAGALGSIGAGYMPPEAIKAAVARTRELSDQPFAINLFVPAQFVVDDASIAAANRVMAEFRSDLAIDTPASISDFQRDFDAQFEVVLEAAPAVFSFTFGSLEGAYVKALKERRILIVGTATTTAEAQVLEQAGVDMIVAQGSDAGGHRGTFIGDFESAQIGTFSLVPQIVDAVSVPVIASGGIMDGRGLTASLMLGACAVQMGSAFLVCEESGANAVHKLALPGARDVDTVVTRAFSGKPARGIRNRFIDAFDAAPVSDYPVHNAWTKDIRSKAGEKGRPEFMSLWAGQAAGLAQPLPAATLVAKIMAEHAALVANP